VYKRNFTRIFTLGVDAIEGDLTLG